MNLNISEIVNTILTGIVLLIIVSWTISLGRDVMNEVGTHKLVIENTETTYQIYVRRK